MTVERHRSVQRRVGGAVMLLVGAYHLGPATTIGAGQLINDLGIQYHHAAETARGAIPLIDFHHTWNVLSWYGNAALFHLAGGDPSVWLYLWSRVFGAALAGVGAMWTLTRLRWSPVWLLAGAGAWLAFSHINQWKYALPVLWLATLVACDLKVTNGAVTQRRRTASAAALRFVIAAVTFWTHVELAILLSAGTIMWDVLDTSKSLLRRSREDWLDLSAKVLAIVAGLLGAVALQSGLYAAAGLEPARLLNQLFGDPSVTTEVHNFHYPLFHVVSLRPKLFLGALLVGFIPWVWRRVSSPTRLTVCLNLALGLIALRRPDAAHVDAAMALFGLVVAMIIHDVSSPSEIDHDLAVAKDLGLGSATKFWTVLGGIVLGVGIITATVSIPHLAAIFILAGGAAALVGLATYWPRGSQPDTEIQWSFSIGVGLALTGITTVAFLGGIATGLNGPDPRVHVAALGEQLSPAMQSCAPDGEIWIIPQPLELYHQLPAKNPTPYGVFWYNFAAEHDEVRRMIARGEIPAILQLGAWPPSVQGLADDFETAFEVCAVVETMDGPATFWTLK